MKKVIRFLTIVSLLSPITLTLNACGSYYEQEIVAAISNKDNNYKIETKPGISKEYLLELISYDFIKKPLDKTIKKKFHNKLFVVDDIINNDTNVAISATDLEKPKSIIHCVILFSYYEVYDQKTNLTINTTALPEPIDINNISINIPTPLEFKVIWLKTVKKEQIEQNIFPILNEKFTEAVNEQEHLFIKQDEDFKLSSNAAETEDYSENPDHTKEIVVTIESLSQSKKIKNSRQITVLTKVEWITIDLYYYDYPPQSIDVELNHETYDDIKTKIRPRIKQGIEELYDTALENKDYEIYFMDQNHHKIKLDEVVKERETIFIVVKAIAGENKPFINEKDIKLEIDDKWS